MLRSMVLGGNCGKNILLEDVENARGAFVVDNSLSVPAHDTDSKFLTDNDNEKVEMMRVLLALTNMLSDLSW